MMGLAPLAALAIAVDAGTQNPQIQADRITFAEFAKRAAPPGVRVRVEPSVAEFELTVYASHTAAEHLLEAAAVSVGANFEKSGNTLHIWITKESLEARRTIAKEWRKLDLENLYWLARAVREQEARAPGSRPKPGQGDRPGIGYGIPKQASFMERQAIELRNQRLRQFSQLRPAVWEFLKICSERDFQMLDAGHYVVAAAPPIHGLIPLRGRPADFLVEAEGVPQAYFRAWRDSRDGGLRMELLAPNARFHPWGNYATGLYRQDLGQPYGPNLIRLSDQLFDWGPAKLLDHPKLVGKYSEDPTPYFPQTMKSFARQTGIDVIGPYSPLFATQLGVIDNSLHELHGCALVRPPYWYLQKELCRRMKELLDWPQPTVSDPVKALDEAAEYGCFLLNDPFPMLLTPQGEFRRFEGISTGDRFGPFWQSLSPKQKASAFGSGLKRRDLFRSQRTLFDDFMLSRMDQLLDHGDVSRLLDLAPRENIVLTLVPARQLYFRYWGDGGGVSTGWGSSPEQTMADYFRYRMVPGKVELSDTLRVEGRFVGSGGGQVDFAYWMHRRLKTSMRSD